MLLLFPAGSQLSRLLRLEHFRLPGENRLEELVKAIGTAQAVRPAQPSGENRKERQDDQRYSHRLRRFVDVVLDFMAHARSAENVRTISRPM